MTRHFLDAISSSQSDDKVPDNQARDKVTDNQARDAINQLISLIIGADTSKPIVGQDELVKYMVICLIMGEHALLEGLPGLAKTQVAERLAKQLGLDFQRAQFVPDMMPSDLIYRQTLKAIESDDETKPVQFEAVDQFGKVFTNILVADEINRAPSKVQAALLEACEERKVSILTKTEPKQVRPQKEDKWLENPTPEDARLVTKYFGITATDDEITTIKKQCIQHFMVIATMNPLEQEGVYPLSEAQFDRFAFRLTVNQPSLDNYQGISKHAFVDSIDDHLSKNSPTQDAKKSKLGTHTHTLYFLTWLEQQIFSKKKNDQWNAKDSIRENLELLINFTHMKKWHNFNEQSEMQTPIAISEYDQKQNDLISTLKTWERQLQDGITDKPYKSWLQSIKKMQSNLDYPDINSGVSPRGLLKLIKAIHVLAYIEGVDKVNWDHVRHMAHPILAHRLNVSPNQFGKSDPSQFIEDLLDCFEPKNEK